MTIAALTACTSPAVNEAHEVMHSALLMPPSLRQSSHLAQLFKEPERDDDRVDWRRFKPDKSHPLAGVRIALDPGHVGMAPWDERGGKYVTNSGGVKLSEGLMALQLALLLEHDLKSLGATVFVDRGGPLPVTARDYRDFQDASGVFFQRVDLDARAEKLWNFHPDITLILHFDAHLDKDMNYEHSAKLCNDTKAYIPGAFSLTELNDKDEQIFFQIIWRNPRLWEDSLALSQAIVEHIHAELAIPLAVEAGESAQFIRPGVFGRNLRLQRRLAGFVTSFLETLCYEYSAEFKALAQKDHKMRIGNETTFYSNRLAELAAAIRGGVVDFVRGR